jgi:hypothetical protein
MWCPGPRNRVQSLPSTDETTLSLVNGHGRFCRERACPRSCARRKLLTIWERHGLGPVPDRRPTRRAPGQPASLHRQFGCAFDARLRQHLARGWQRTTRRAWPRRCPQDAVPREHSASVEQRSRVLPRRWWQVPQTLALRPWPSVEDTRAAGRLPMVGVSCICARVCIGSRPQIFRRCCAR